MEARSYVVYCWNRSMLWYIPFYSHNLAFLGSRWCYDLFHGLARGPDNVNIMLYKPRALKKGDLVTKTLSVVYIGIKCQMTALVFHSEFFFKSAHLYCMNINADRPWVKIRALWIHVLLNNKCIILVFLIFIEIGFFRNNRTSVA